MNRYCITGLVLALCFSTRGGASIAPTAPSNGTAWFLQRTQALYDAVTSGDKRIWERTLAEDCIITDEDGRVYDRSAFLETLRPLPPGFTGDIRVRRLTVRALGTAASVHYWLDERENALGDELHTRYVETDAYRLVGNTWKMVSAQVTVVPADLRPVQVDKRDWHKLVGTYQLGERPGLSYHAYLRGGSLYWGSDARSARLLIPLSPLVFFEQGSIHTLVFVQKAGDGITEALELHKYNEVALPRVPQHAGAQRVRPRP